MVMAACAVELDTTDRRLRRPWVGPVVVFAVITLQSGHRIVKDPTVGSSCLLLRACYRHTQLLRNDLTLVTRLRANSTDDDPYQRTNQTDCAPYMHASLNSALEHHP